MSSHITAEHAQRLLESFKNKGLRIIVGECSAQGGDEDGPFVELEFPDSDENFSVATVLVFTPDALRTVIDLHGRLATVGRERDERVFTLTGEAVAANVLLRACAKDLAAANLRAENAERERDALARTLRFRERLDAAYAHLAKTRQFSRGNEADDAANAYGVFADYGGMLRERRHDSARGFADVAEACGVTFDDLAAVEQRRLPPFDEATTRKLCAYLGCDPRPLLEAATRAEEALR